VKSAIAGFIIPYMFVFGPQILLKGGVLEVLASLATGLFGVMALASAVQGCFLANIGPAKRTALLIGSLLLIKPGWITDLCGLAIVAAEWVVQIAVARNEHAAASRSAKSMQ